MKGHSQVTGDSDSVKLEKPLPNSNVIDSQSNQSPNNNEDNDPRYPRCGSILNFNGNSIWCSAGCHLSSSDLQ